ncbi:MAG: amylo-alpha-1,6-glucosidase [Anaerolineaceae bacterium]|nr:amylo-alpha-1,6-glucosidase [Anaerolineaceae bacterium]
MIELGRDILNSSETSTEREWLITNGTGSFAMGTVSGILTRRYHGLLVAALQPPLGRTVLVTKVDETLRYDDTDYDLFSNQWQGDEDDEVVTKPHGYLHLNTFALDGSTPVWVYNAGDALLEKRVWMAYGQDTTYVRYTLLRSTCPAHLRLKVLVNDRDFHTNTHVDDWTMDITPIENGLKITPQPGSPPFSLHVVGAGQITPQHTWYQNYFLNQEAYRGLDATGDHLYAALVEGSLQVGESLTLVCTAESAPDLDVDGSYQQQQTRETALLARSSLKNAPGWMRQLVLAADQFIVRRQVGADAEGRTIIAGYPWFSDWGRDTMISLPGLTLTTGRSADAALILRTFAAYVNQGMLPNRFPDQGETPEYNTVDATLWYFEAIRQYVAATQDTGLLRELYPVLQGIIQWHLKGTRYRIHVDPVDGLLYAGDAGVQLTWMDAKVGDWVVTPRTGKAVEINALWYNALRTMADFAQQLQADAAEYITLAERVQASFARFWNTEKGCCFDVLDTPTGNDAALRPNQLFAVSLFHSPLSPEQQQSIVDQCARTLVTPHGLRSLAPSEPGYTGHYGGDQTQRDGSYHQGTTWGWLIGPFVQAHLRVYRNPELARSYLAAFRHHLNQHCIGTIAEIFDGDAPFTPRGAIAQAWSVAEVLRAWQMIEAY